LNFVSNSTSLLIHAFDVQNQKKQKIIRLCLHVDE
jgi:hypothetical protein